MKKVNLLIGTFVSALLIGCGGGGGGSTTSTSSNSSNLFPSNAKLANPTKDNVQEVASYISSNTPDSNDGLLLSTDSKGVNVESLLLKLTPDVKNLPINEVINEKEPCSDGGYMEINGQGDDFGGNVNVVYSNCKEDGLIINGSMYVKGSSYNEECDEVTHYEFKILNDVSIVYGSDQIVLQKNSQFIADETLDVNCLISSEHYSNVNILETINGEKRGMSNGDYVINVSSNPYTITYNSGNIYIHELEKYATIVKTETPLAFGTNGLEDGDIKLKFDGGNVDLKVENGKLKGYVDNNGDGEADEVFDITN